MMVSLLMNHVNIFIPIFLLTYFIGLKYNLQTKYENKTSPQRRGLQTVKKGLYISQPAIKY